MKNLEEKVVEVLRIHKNEKLTINEIVLKIFKIYPDLENMYNLQVVDQPSKKSGFAQCCAEIGSRYVSSKSFPIGVLREKNDKDKYIYFIVSNPSLNIPIQPISAIVNEEVIEIKNEDESTLYPILNQ